MSFPGSILLTQGDEYVQTAAQRHPLGTRGYTRDGRVFRYAKAGASEIAIAKLCSAAVQDSDYNVDLNPDTATAPTTGSTTITLQLATAATIALDEVKEGYLRINDGTGEGQMVIIAGNAANTGAATGTWDVYIRPECCFTVAPTTACEMGIIKNMYDDVIIRPDSARTSAPVGVTPRAVTANYYFWLQTWGPAVISTVGTVVVGKPVTDDTASSTGTAGSIHTMLTTSTVAAVAGATHPAQGMFLGNVLGVGATGEQSLIDLKLSP